jgi:hypothetical protein
LNSISANSSNAVQRFSVTQLINYQRCPRQYYFDRVLEVPAADQLAVWNNAEAPEPPANLNATLKGAVIHRFCETYAPGDVLEERLKASFDDVIRSRQAQLADRLDEIDVGEALKELTPLAQNYLASEVFQRVEQTRKMSGDLPLRVPAGKAGLWSELSFRLRRPQGILTGTIDKLLITPTVDGGFKIENIDFNTNRIGNTPADGSGIARQIETSSSLLASSPANVEHVEAFVGGPNESGSKRAKRSRSHSDAQQFALNFEAAAVQKTTVAAESSDELTITEQVGVVAADYQLQMQAYALAVQELLPAIVGASSKVRVTLHFLHPNVEWTLPDELLTPESCRAAIDEAMQHIIASCSPEQFPVRPARHCRMCSFLRICSAGRHFVAGSIVGKID